MLFSKKNKPIAFKSLDLWKTNLYIYLRIIKLLRPHWLSSLGAVACMGLSTGFALVVPWLLAWVIDTGLQHGQFSTLLLATAAILVTSSLRGLCAYGQGYLSQAVSNLVAYDLRGHGVRPRKGRCRGENIGGCGAHARLGVDSKRQDLASLAIWAIRRTTRGPAPRQVWRV